MSKYTNRAIEKRLDLKGLNMLRSRYNMNAKNVTFCVIPRRKPNAKKSNQCSKQGNNPSVNNNAVNPISSISRKPPRATRNRAVLHRRNT